MGAKRTACRAERKGEMRQRRATRTTSWPRRGGSRGGLRRRPCCLRLLRPSELEPRDVGQSLVTAIGPVEGEIDVMFAGDGGAHLDGAWRVSRPGNRGRPHLAQRGIVRIVQAN